MKCNQIPQDRRYFQSSNKQDNDSADKLISQKECRRQIEDYEMAKQLGVKVEEIH